MIALLLRPPSQDIDLAVFLLLHVRRARRGASSGARRSSPRARCGRERGRARERAPRGLRRGHVARDTRRLAAPAPAVAGGVTGLHAWVWSLPVVALASAAFPTARDAVGALRLLGFVSVPLAVLAAVQIWALALNESYYQKIHGASVYWVGSRLVADRSVSTFASTGAYADFVVFVVIVAFALVLRARDRRRAAEAVGGFRGVVLAPG